LGEGEEVQQKTTLYLHDSTLLFDAQQPDGFPLVDERYGKAVFTRVDIEDFRSDPGEKNWILLDNTPTTTGPVFPYEWGRSVDIQDPMPFL